MDCYTENYNTCYLQLVGGIGDKRKILYSWKFCNLNLFVKQLVHLLPLLGNIGLVTFELPQVEHNFGDTYMGKMLHW